MVDVFRPGLRLSMLTFFVESRSGRRSIVVAIFPVYDDQFLWVGGVSGPHKLKLIAMMVKKKKSLIIL